MFNLDSTCSDTRFQQVIKDELRRPGSIKPGRLFYERRGGFLRRCSLGLAIRSVGLASHAELF